MNTIGGIAFGNYDPLDPNPRDADMTIKYSCPPGRVVRVELDAGSSGSFAKRTMTNGISTLEYNLYLDAARQKIWGDGSPPYPAGPEVTQRSGKDWTAWVFGRISAGQQVSPGTYTDTIRVTIQF